MLASLVFCAVGQRSPLPPPLPVRPIAEDRSLWRGALRTLTDGDLTLELYVPNAWDRKREKGLWVHFHTVAWHVVQEHALRGVERPLLVFNNGQGSSRYQAPFQDRGRFARWLELVSLELGQRVEWVEVTSFSAGYGAVREIVQNPADLALIRRVVLFDSMYAGFEAEGSREPERAQIEAWVPLAREAAEGRKTFVFTNSRVRPDTYAASYECAAALVSRLGGSLLPVEPGTLAATLDSDHPLIERYDRGGFHVWGYGGTDGPAHLAHVRHMAALMRALDLVGSP